MFRLNKDTRGGRRKPLGADCLCRLRQQDIFQNIKRGGILLVQMSVCALYIFSVPRGYQDGFNQWMKQVAAICLTAFMQTPLLFLGLLTFPRNMLLRLGIMLAADEVPRIAQQFGLQIGTYKKTEVLQALIAC